MYNRFYGFRENPFNQTPDTSFFFASEGHQSALNAMVYAIQQRKGFIVITGEIGSGKTTVARTLLRKMDNNIKSALITNTHLSPKGILTFIMEDLGIKPNGTSKEKLLIQLNEFLIQQMQSDTNVVLIIDEAQNLSPACLEEVRMLSNLETEKEKLIQIILIGQPELKQKLELPILTQLRQRVSVYYHLSPLSIEDTKRYIVHRLNLVRSNGRDYYSLFDDRAIEQIYRVSRGIPRIINNLCDHALLTGFVSEAPVITENIVAEAASSVLKA